MKYGGSESNLSNVIGTIPPIKINKPYSYEDFPELLEEMRKRVEKLFND